MSNTNKILQIQTETIKSIETLTNLVTKIATTLSNEKGTEYDRVKGVLENEREKIERLELTTAVVAPMKSGKSTIINAIVGQELLPTRNAAMTTLPTKVLLKSDLVSARLLLSEELILACQDLISSVIVKTDRWPEERDMVTDKAPHLAATLEDILSGKAGAKIVGKIEGNERIMEALILLNEIIRISSYLDISVDKLNKQNELPCIETPYSKDIVSNKTFGNLTIIDTPGPNEAGQDHLGQIVEDQLQRCSVVIFVLNYTQLNAEAEERMKKEVEKIIDLRGKENLFVLVNKVDARSSDRDMSTLQVLQYVKHLFRFDDDNYEERIFEISAHRALVASRCSFGMDKNDPEDTAVRDLLKIAEPYKWERKLNNISKEEIQEHITDVWASSNFSPFLEKAITKLLTNAAPIAIRSAINQSLGILTRLTDDAALRKSGIDTEIKAIQAELGTLGDDLAKVLKKREELNNVETIKIKLAADLVQAGKKVPVALPDEIKKRFNGERTVSFSSTKDSTAFIQEIKKAAREELKMVTAKYQQEVQSKLQEGQNNIMELMTRNVQPIIDEVKRRIERTFKVDISFGELNVADLLLQENELNALTPNKKKRTWNEKEPRYRREYVELGGLRRWFNKNLGTDFDVDTREVFDGFDVIQKESVDYEVYLPDLEQAHANAIQANIRSVEDLATTFIREHIDEQIRMFFDNVDDHLGRYKNSLLQMEKDNQLNEEEKQELKRQLAMILAHAQTEKAKLQATEKQLRELFPKM